MKSPIIQKLKNYKKPTSPRNHRQAAPWPGEIVRASFHKVVSGAQQRERAIP